MEGVCVEKDACTLQQSVMRVTRDCGLVKGVEYAMYFMRHRFTACTIDGTNTCFARTLTCSMYVYSLHMHTTHTCARIHIYICMHARVCTHIHMHTYIYRQLY
jgi:hypothetical protein